MTESIESRIIKPSPKMQYLAGCIYGRGGVGKTTLLGTMPGKGIVIDVPHIEGGSIVLADHQDRIGLFQASDWGDLAEIYGYLRNDRHSYKWVAIDTLTAIQELAKRKTLKDREGILGADPHTISQQDWGKIGQLDAEVYYKFKLLPMHVIFNAQERLRGTDEGALEYQPDVSPSALSSLLPPMYLVGRLYIQEVTLESGATEWQRRLRVGPHYKTVTKVRALPGRQLPPVIVHPHLGHIFAYLLGKDVPAPEGVGSEEGGVLGIVD